MNIIVNKTTTAIACINTNRNFIGIELDSEYFKIAEKRISWDVDANEKLVKELKDGSK